MSLNHLGVLEDLDRGVLERVHLVRGMLLENGLTPATLPLRLAA